jgi:acyl-CoA thioester hydrolase
LQKLTYKLPIYTYQIDFGQHVSNIVYIQWMEIGRLNLLSAVGLPVEQTIERGFSPLLVETSISYKQPLLLGDNVLAEVWISELSLASAWIEHRFYNGNGVIAATGRQRGLFVDRASGRPKRLSPEDRALFEPYVMNDSIAPNA